MKTFKNHSKKIKWKSAEQKRNYAELENDWNELLKKYPPLSTKPLNKSIQKIKVPPGRETPFIQSKPDTVLGAISTKAPMKYTGTKIVGIGTMHKSNAVPIFNDNEAKEISSMRR